MADKTPATTDEAKAPRKAVNRNIGPRPAYVLVNLPEGVSASDIEVVSVTRKAEEALEGIDTGAAAGYVRIMVK